MNRIYASYDQEMKNAIESLCSDINLVVACNRLPKWDSAVGQHGVDHLGIINAVETTFDSRAN